METGTRKESAGRNGMKILAYVRPFSLGYYQHLIPSVWPDAQWKPFSDFRAVDEAGLVERFYGILKERSGRTVWPDYFSVEERYDLISRSLVLRRLPLREAESLAAAMISAIESVFDTEHPELIVSMQTDSYVIDCIRRVARHRKIPFLGMAGSNIPGYTWLSSRGELLDFRTPSPSEVETMAGCLGNVGFKPDYTKDWMRAMGSNVFKMAFRESIKRHVFNLKAKRESDPFNHHYLAAKLTDVRFNDVYFRAKKYFTADWSPQNKPKEPITVYLPLQTFPEASIDYFVPDRKLLDYPSLLPELIARLSSAGDIRIIAKEHPGMFGRRPSSFYESFAHMPRVDLVDWRVDSNEVLPLADVVLVWTGTVGVEAAVKGKPVITVGDPYYADGAAYTQADPSNRFESIVEQVRDVVNTSLTQEDQHAPVTKLLKGCIPGKFKFINFDASDPEQVQETHKLVKALQMHFDAWRESHMQDIACDSK